MRLVFPEPLPHCPPTELGAGSFTADPNRGCRPHFHVAPSSGIWTTQRRKGRAPGGQTNRESVARRYRFRAGIAGSELNKEGIRGKTFRSPQVPDREICCSPPVTETSSPLELQLGETSGVWAALDLQGAARPGMGASRSEDRRPLRRREPVQTFGETLLQGRPP